MTEKSMIKKEKNSTVVYTKERLDSFVRDIEFLLISVVQGVALAALAASAASVIGEFQYEYILYVVSGFTLIILFWSQAIMHTISFIDWPLDMTHNFLYFLASFFEVIAFAHINEPFKWFIFIGCFAIVGVALYIFDYILIKKHEVSFRQSSTHEKLYQHISKRQIFELKVIIPGALAFNFIAAYLIFNLPSVFIDQKFHLVLISLQILSNIIVIMDLLKSFKKRTQLISECIEG